MDNPRTPGVQVKKPYQAPRLIVHGDVEDLTKGPRRRGGSRDAWFGRRLRDYEHPPPGS